MLTDVVLPTPVPKGGGRGGSKKGKRNYSWLSTPIGCLLKTAAQMECEKYDPGVVTSRRFPPKECFQYLLDYFQKADPVEYAKFLSCTNDPLNCIAQRGHKGFHEPIGERGNSLRLTVSHEHYTNEPKLQFCREDAQRLVKRKLKP